MLFRLSGVLHLIIVLSLIGVEPAPGQDREPDVLYVPTPQPVVEEMLRLANLQEGELLYDLGSGDGRFVITAAHDFGARGVGVDIDRELVEQSRANAEAAGVDDRVRFIHGDLFELDFSDADVVTLFLLTELNLRLRPMLLAELRPGARVVSHLFGMREWRPDVKLVLEEADRNHEVYLWIIPADVAGGWELSLDRDPSFRARLVLDQQFQEISGFLDWNGRRIEVSEAELSGEQLSLTFVRDDVTIAFEGSVYGDLIEGCAAHRINDLEGRDRWTARRIAGH